MSLDLYFLTFLQQLCALILNERKHCLIVSRQDINIISVIQVPTVKLEECDCVAIFLMMDACCSIRVNVERSIKKDDNKFF